MSNTETGYTLNRRQRQKLKRRREPKDNINHSRGAPVAGTSKKPQRKN